MLGAILGGLVVWGVCVALPDLVVIPAGVIRKQGPRLAKKLWDKIRRRSPKE